MSRLLPLLVFAVLLTALITGISLAQDDRPQGQVFDLRTVDPSTLPKAMIDGALDEPPANNSTESISSLFSAEPADLCQDAEDLSPIPGGIDFDTIEATESAGDPVLSCMWGNPHRTQGFRTVWYRFAPAVNGRFTLSTLGSDYDTVLGVYKFDPQDGVTGSEECDNLVPIRCSDDANGFSSQTTFSASGKDVYYIEVADWQFGAPNPPILSFSALQEPVFPLWETVLAGPSSPAVTRHAAVSRDDKLYLVGGQTGGIGVPEVSNQVLRLDTYNNRWEEMANIPGAGYSNTTAAMVDRRIFLPSGFNGTGYDALHWVFDPDFGSSDVYDKGGWSIVAPIPTGEPFGWAASAVPPSSDRYYLIGGTSAVDPFDITGKTFPHVYLYIPRLNLWDPKTPLPSGRYGHTATWIDTNNLGVCVAGGVNHQPGSESFTLVTVTECYEPSAGVWKSYATLNIPRFGAGSAVGPDGRWYMFGGLTSITDADGVVRLQEVLQTEVYDPLRNTWSILPPEYNLGGLDLGSARAYPDGSFIENELYVSGGSIDFGGENALPLTEKLEIPPVTAFLPMVVAYGPDYLLPDDNFSQARTLPPDFVWKGSFNGQIDFFDFFTFTLTTNEAVRIDLQVPDGNDFDLYLYGDNKLQWGSSTNPFTGWDEQIEIALTPRRYFIMVERSQPEGSPDKDANYELKWTIQQ